MAAEEISVSPPGSESKDSNKVNSVHSSGVQIRHCFAAPSDAAGCHASHSNHIIEAMRRPYSTLGEIRTNEPAMTCSSCNRLVDVSSVDCERLWVDVALMTSSHLDFDCDFRRAASHEVVQIDQIVRQAMLKIYGRPEGDRSFIQSPFFAEIAVVGSEIIGVAAFLDGALSCLYVAERFRNSGVGTCLLHNAMLSGIRTALIPSGNDRVKTFFTHRGWYAGKENPADGGYGIFPKVVMHCGVQNQKIKLS